MKWNLDYKHSYAMSKPDGLPMKKKASLIDLNPTVYKL
jgi:hypothetical protein